MKEKNTPHDDRPVVYSSEKGDLRKQKAVLPPPKSLPPAQQTIYLHRESKGRGGKVVTLVKNFQLAPEDLKEVAADLKKTCGTGGTIKDGIIEIQGDHRAKLSARLQQLGYKTKIAGG